MFRKLATSSKCILGCGLALGIFAPFDSAHAAASGFSVYYTFTGGKDGEYPEAGLTVDQSDGTLYTTTFGALGTPVKNCGKSCGTSDSFQGGQLTSAYSFLGGGDGAFPTGEVAFDSGTVYGTTESGGGTACGGLGCGTVFAITNGTETGFVKFCPNQDYPACANGALPRGGPIMGTDGYLYGTTTLGGSGNGLACDNNFDGCGIIYRLPSVLDKHTVPTVLFSFCQQRKCQDGAVPYGRLLQDTSSGNLYGTTEFGGKYGAGTIFAFNLSTGKHTVLYNFCSLPGCSDGVIPEAGLFEDNSGNFYGTASAGGRATCKGSTLGCGVVFELTSSGVYTVLHTFAGRYNGALPQAPVVMDTSGNLYGTTNKGGHGRHCYYPKIGCGTVFMLQPDGTNWTETLLHVFGEEKSRKDGAQPEGALLLYNGLLYGATNMKGSKSCACGTLYTISVGSRTAIKSPRARTGTARGSS